MKKHTKITALSYAYFIKTHIFDFLAFPGHKPHNMGLLIQRFSCVTLNTCGVERTLGGKRSPTVLKCNITIINI